MTPDAGRRQAGRWVRTAVLVFSLLCFAWVLWPIFRHGRELAESLRGGRLSLAVALGILAYTALAVLLAVAWWWLSDVYGGRISLRVGYAVYARSQLAKYLPGNAFHYVSRQLLGRRAGLTHPALVASGLLELGSLMLAALLLAGAGLGLARADVPDLVAWPWALAVGLASLLAWPGLDLALRRLPATARWMAGLPHLSPLRTLRLLGPSLGLHLLFFAGTGAVLLALVASSRPDLTVGAWKLVWIYPLAWVAGTVSVGAPAGVGVREAILTFGLQPFVGPAGAAAVALALRLVTTGGDLVTAGLGWWLDRQEDSASRPQ